MTRPKTPSNPLQMTSPILRSTLTAVLLFGAVSCQRGPQLFTDIAARDDMEFVSYTGDYIWYLIDTLGAGLAAGDYDDDGRPDLVLLSGSAITDEFQEEASRYSDALWRNEGGRFVDVTTETRFGKRGWSNGAVFADYDGDGDLDIFIARHGPDQLWRNNGDGSFTDVAEQAGVASEKWGVAGAFSDLDGDGDLDLYVANYAVFDIEAQKGTVNWFTVEQFPHYFPPAENTLYANNGDGTFTDITEEAAVPGTGRSMTVLTTDYDDDGDPDLFVANDIGFNDLYENLGNMTFENVSIFSGVACDAQGNFQATMGAASGDFDNDGDMDYVVTNYGGEYHTLYRNEGDGLFTDITPTSGLVTEEAMDTVGWGVGLHDLDLDGHLDILMVTGHVVRNFVLNYMRWRWTDDSDELAAYPQMSDKAFNLPADQPKLLFFGRGDGTFRDGTREVGSAFVDPRMSRGAAFADFDGDGRLDVAVSNKNQAAQVFLNRIPAAGHWLKLDLRAPPPNVFSVGARVRVTTDRATHTREILAGSSYCSGNDHVIHVGLGQATRIERVTIRWPDGRESSHANLEIDRAHRIEYPFSTTPANAPVATAARPDTASPDGLHP